MLKIDHRKTLNALYQPSRRQPALVDVPALNFLMLDGRGKPTGSDFQQAAGLLYPLAYTIKFIIRAACDIDFHVMPMEVRWRVNREKKEFAWTMMLMQPEFVSAEIVAEARQKVQSKVDAAALERVRFESLREGLCIQVLHVGPYPEMDAALDRMAATAEQQGYILPARNSHDIYLNDARKTRPENLRSVMRMQVAPR